jgi:hypothetical protein
VADWPDIPSLLTPISTITPYDLHSIGIGGGGPGGPASATWASANLALYIPFRISAPLTITQLFLMNGATASGNVDIGIYDTAGTRIIATGTTGQVGTNVIQAVNVADTLIGPGAFYFALALNGTTGTVFMSTSFLAAQCQLVGMAQQPSAFPLPATATFASCAFTGCPMMGVATQALV